jgi:serine/threonine protein phosphatase PrpC
MGICQHLKLTISGAKIMPWKAILGNATGTSHLSAKKPYQDWGDLDFVYQEDAIIGVVADGAGSAARSEEGAQCAVESMIFYLQEHQEWKTLVDEQSTRHFFEQAVQHTFQRIKSLADSKEYFIEDLNCTLLAFIATPRIIISMQVGDGLVIVRHGTSEKYQLIFQPDEGENYGETTFLTSKNLYNSLQTNYQEIEQPIFIFLSTDGIQRIAAKYEVFESGKIEWIPFTPFLRNLEEHIESAVDLYEAEKKLVDFLESEKVNNKTDDDKTILMCLFEQEDKWNAQMVGNRESRAKKYIAIEKNEVDDSSSLTMLDNRIEQTCMRRKRYRSSRRQVILFIRSLLFICNFISASFTIILLIFKSEISYFWLSSFLLSFGISFFLYSTSNINSR